MRRTASCILISGPLRHRHKRIVNRWPVNWGPEVESDWYTRVSINQMGLTKHQSIELPSEYGQEEANRERRRTREKGFLFSVQQTGRAWENFSLLLMVPHRVDWNVTRHLLVAQHNNNKTAKVLRGKQNGRSRTSSRVDAARYLPNELFYAYLQNSVLLQE